MKRGIREEHLWIIAVWSLIGLICMFILASNLHGQSLPDETRPQIAHEGQYIAPGDTLPEFPDNLIMAPRKEDGRDIWHVEKVNSCWMWCGRPISYKKAAFDEKMTGMWLSVFALRAIDIEMSHRAPCIKARTCREGDPILGRTRAQQYGVSSALIGLSWWGTAWLRKGDKEKHIGGMKNWYWIPVVHQAFSLIAIGANAARW